MRVRNLTVVVMAMIAACGDDDDGGKGGGSGGGSYSAIADSIAKPTGTLSTSNAVDVAEEFEKNAVAGVGGGQLKQAQDQKISCPAGGSYTVSASGSQTSSRAEISYDNCCYTAGCCIEGDADWYYAGQAGSTYSFCGDYDLQYACGGQTSSLTYSGCQGTDGKWVLSVRVGDRTYAVSGTYRDGTGTLKITDSKGTWTCTYNKGTGSCTGGGSNFSF